MFLGVLLIVANVAQNYFGTTYGVLYGGAAAGLLFFGLAPIQRAAERFAQKAVPVSVAAPANRRKTTDDLAAFRHVALRLAADGSVSADDHPALAVLADDMGLGAVAVADVLADAERAAASKRKGAR